MSTRIVRNPQVQSGMPCIEGTRWPTQTTTGWDYDVDRMIEAYPHLTRQQIEAACTYERSMPQRLRRKVWDARFWIAAKVLGEDVEWLRQVV